MESSGTVQDKSESKLNRNKFDDSDNLNDLIGDADELLRVLSDINYDNLDSR